MCPRISAPRLLALAICGAVGCTGFIDDAYETPRDERPDPWQTPEDAAPDVAWAPAALLTSAQYANAVEDLLGVRPTLALPAENRTDLFVDNAEQHIATMLSEDARADIAEGVAASIEAAELALQVGCSADCNEVTLAPFLRRAFRRDTPTDEASALLSLITAGDDVTDGLRLLVEVVLLSPQFVYRFDVSGGTPDGDGVSPADDFTLASRLSFFLWASGPDDRLLDLAAGGELRDDDVITAEVERMMADARFERTIDSFHAQWLALDDVDELIKVGDGVDGFETRGASWRRSIDAYIRETFDGGLDALLTRSDYPLTDDLASAYGFEPSGSALGLETYAFDPAERSGLLTHPSLMAKLAHPDQDSPVRRGVFIYDRLLCRHLPSPPMDVDTTPPPVDPASTTRERTEVLTGYGSCASCHQQFNPIGYLFSHFDTTGRFVETTDAGRALDARAEVRGLSDELDGAYEGAPDFAYALAESDEVRDCVADQWVRYAIGRPVGDRDVRTVFEARAAFRESAGDFQDLMRAIATGPAFRLVRRTEGVSR
jgi:hypothetical protein